MTAILVRGRFSRRGRRALFILGAFSVLAGPEAARARQKEDPLIVLKQNTFQGRIYFVDAAKDGRLIFSVVHHRNMVVQRHRLSLDERLALSDEARRKAEWYAEEHGEYGLSGESEVEGPETCELRSNASVRVVGGEVTAAFEAGSGRQSPAWKDRRGFLHSVDVLARQLRYDKWNADAGATAPPIPVTGILDSRTLWSDSEMMRDRLQKTRQSLSLASARTGLQGVCVDALAQSAPCGADSGAEQRVSRVRLAVDAADTALELYDAALKQVRLATPKPVVLPVFDPRGGGKGWTSFANKLEDLGMRPAWESETFGLGAVACDSEASDFPPTSGEPEDQLGAEVDVRAFGPAQAAALGQLQEQAQKAVDNAAVAASRLR